MGAGRNAKRMGNCFNPPYTQKEQQNERTVAITEESHS
jgi:hypothetical protein